MGVAGKFDSPFGWWDNLGAKHRKVTGSDGRWQQLLICSCEHDMYHSGVKGKYLEVAIVSVTLLGELILEICLIFLLLIL